MQKIFIFISKKLHVIFCKKPVSNLIVNGTDIVRVGEDYENPETGEYVRWDKDAKGVDKTFSFKIRYSVSSSKFTVHSTKVSVKAKMWEKHFWIFCFQKLLIIASTDNTGLPYSKSIDVAADRSD